MNNLSNTQIGLSGPEDPKIIELCNERREKLKTYIDFILSKIMNANKYPIGLRITCKKLKELAKSKEPNNERLKNSLIGGFIFLRIFNPKIAYYGKLKSQQEGYKKYAGSVRRKFTLISKILQNISNQVQGGMKEKWMASMNDYIISKCQSVSKFFEELTDIPPLSTYFELDRQILSNSKENDSVYISISDLKLLTTMIDDDKQKQLRQNKKFINSNNKHYYDLIEEIKKKKMFSQIPQNDGIQYFVQIIIPKPYNFINDNNMNNVNVNININNIINNNSNDYDFNNNNNNNNNEQKLELNLKIKVIPVLRELYGKEDLIYYLVDLKTSNLVTDTINFLKFAQQTLNLSDLQQATNVLMKYPNDKITTKLLIKLYQRSSIDTKIFNRLNFEVKEMKKYSNKLEKEVKHLEVEFDRIQREQAKAAQQQQQQDGRNGPGRGLDNIFRLINARRAQQQNNNNNNNNKNNNSNNKRRNLQSSYNNNNDQKEVDPDVGLTEDIVAVDGMIGNMLLTLVKDVGQSMSTNIKRGLKTNSKDFISIWSKFPQNVPSYFPIIQRVARLGKMCMHELISTIIEADKDNGRGNNGKRFKLTVLRQHIKQQNSEQNQQICQYVIDFMMVDLLQHCMKWIAPRDLYVTTLKGKYNSFHIDVNNTCIRKLQTIKHDKLGSELSKKWKLKRLRKWGVLISILSPTYPENVVQGFKLCYQNKTSDADGFLFGASYIKFHCDTDSVPIMQEYFDWVKLLIQQNKTNPDKLKLIMLTLEHNIRGLTINNDINNSVFVMKIQNECFTELYRILSQKNTKKNFNKNFDLLTSPFRRLRSSLLLRCPGTINNHQEAAQWLSSLADFKLAEKKNTQKASDLLHFMRGGGSSWDESIKRLNRASKSGSSGGGGGGGAPSLLRKNTSYIQGYGGSGDDGNPILEQAYGRVEPRLQLNSSLCKILCDKLFKPSRKYDRNKQSVQMFMLSACAIQLCVHNFQYAITNVIQAFMAHDKDVSIERLFIAVYALNFICLPECKFTEFMRVKIVGAYGYQNVEQANLAWNEMNENLNKEKRKISPQLKALFNFLGTRAMPIQKNLLSSNDARQNFSADTLQAQDEKIMFQNHVRKMLLFDWTDIAMEDYMVPIENIEIELLIYCLRLAPHIQCEELWEPTEHNCSKTGTFIGKWLLHKDEKVREQVLRTLLVAMKDSTKRSLIMKCFIEMLLHHDWQTPACLTMLLKTITHLLDHYRKLVVLEEETKKRHNVQRMHPHHHQQPHNKHLNGNEDPLRKGKELPQWFAWQNRADALGLVLLCHYHTQVRVHALEFLNKITEIYKEFTGVGGGSVYIQKTTLLQLNNIKKNTNNITESKHNNNNNKPYNNNINNMNNFAAKPMVKSRSINTIDAHLGLGERTVGGLITTHGRSIARMATMKYEEEQQTRLNDMNGGDSSQLNNNNQGHINQQLNNNNHNHHHHNNGHINHHHHHQLHNSHSNNHNNNLSPHHHQDIATRRRSSTYQQQTANVDFGQCIHQWGLIPFCISQLGKRVVNSHLHETILCVIDVLLYTLSFMPPHTAASRDRTGWSSQQEWQGNHFIRGYWISLHTLFFSIIGCGLSNPFSISTKKDIEYFKLNRKGLRNESFKLTEKQFEAYLDEFWYCLYEESLWVRDAVNAILQETNWESIPIVLNSINKSYLNAVKKKRRGKNIISDTVYLLKNLSQIGKFSGGIYIGGEEIVEMCFKFINDVKNQAFRPDRIEKKRWWDTQTELAEFYGYFLKALSKIGAHNELRNEFWSFEFKQESKNNKSIIEIRKTWLQKKRHAAAGAIKKDPMPHIKKSKTNDRFLMFKWLLQFLVDVDNIVTPFVDPQDAREQRQRTIKVRRAVFMGLQYLLNMGQVIPNKKFEQDNYIINLLRGTKGIDKDFINNYSLQASAKNKCILTVFIEAEIEKFQVLTPLLTFQFESLISFYIEQASTHQNAKHLFFRAIVNVIQENNGISRLTSIDSGYGKNDWKIIRQRGNGFLESVFHYAHKLLFLGFIMIIESSPDTRYCGYLLLKSMASILVGKQLIDKIDKLKFAFESSMSLWVRKNGILISQYFANAYPALGSFLFRVCIQYAEDKDRAEWISAFLKPWATVMHLMPDTIITDKSIPKYVKEYNQQYIHNTDNNDDNKNEEYKQEQEYKIHQHNKHETFALLSRLFDSTVDAKDDLQTSFLKVWTDLSQAFQYENLFAILDFVLKKVEEQKKLQMSTFKTTIMPTVKNIFFAIYEPVLNRAVMTVYIVRIILTVLKIGAEEYRQQGLIVKQRAAQILSTLQERLARQENDNVAFGGIHYDIHHEILQHVNGKKSLSSLSMSQSSRELISNNSNNKNNNSGGGGGGHGSDKKKKNPLNQKKRYRNTNPHLAAGVNNRQRGGNSQDSNKNNNNVSFNIDDNINSKKNDLTSEEKRASIAASLLVELIGVDCEPIKPYFPVLVLYAALYIDKPSNHASMHNLLVRLIATLTTQKTIEEIEKNSHSIDDNKPSLSAALTSRTLELLWDEDIDGNASKKQFVHNQGDYVAIDGATFVREYCSKFELIHKPNLRTGYEALRWAVLSTNPELTTRSFHIYKQLLNPLDHCTVKVMLLALCGAIDNWESSERESHSVSGSMSVSVSQISQMGISRPASYSTVPVDSIRGKLNRDIKSQEFRETMRILDTIIRMAEKLKEMGQIYQYDSFVWTGIALLRADVKIEKQKQVFKKGLELLNIVLDDEDLSLQYLFVNSFSLNKQQTILDQINIKEKPKRQSRKSIELINKNNNNKYSQTPMGQNQNHNNYNNYGQYQTPFGGGGGGGVGGTAGGPNNNNNNNNRSRYDNNNTFDYNESKSQYPTQTPKGPSHRPINSMSNHWGGGAHNDDHKQSGGGNNQYHTPSLNYQSNDASNQPDWQYDLDDYDYEPSYSNNEPFGFGQTPMGFGGQTMGGDFAPNQGYGQTRGGGGGGGIVGVNNGNNDTRYIRFGNNNMNMNNNGYGGINGMNNNMNININNNINGMNNNNEYDIYSNDLAESFLAYCIDWSPPFEGIHPYLLQGLLQNDIEHKTFRILIKVLTTKMDKLADRSSARPCLCIVACLPYIYYIIRFKPEYFATISHSLFESLILLTSGNSNSYNPYSRLQSKFEHWSNHLINIDNVNILLKELCQCIVQTFFAEHAGLVANYLNAILSTSKMAHHHTTVYKMAALFLNEDPNYIRAFNDIIVSAHKTVSEKVDKANVFGDVHSQSIKNSNNKMSTQHLLIMSNVVNNSDNDMSEMADAATELVATGIDYLKAREKQNFIQNYNEADFESTVGGDNDMNNNDNSRPQIFRWNVDIDDVTPFPQTGLKDVSNALWGVVKETRSVV